MRYFKSSELQSAVGKLSVQIANLRNRNDKEYSFLEMNIRPFTLQYYDFDWYKVLIADGTKTLLEALISNTALSYNGKIINADKFNRKEAENLASYYLLMLRGTRKTQYLSYINANHQLLEILRKEYHLNDEKVESR